MSESKPQKKQAPPKSYGWMAEYEDEHQLLDAARKVKDSGYTRIDAFTPFPVHGIDEALGIKPTVLPWFTFCAGATGTLVALLMQWWTNAYDYPYIISGKPFASWPAFIPVAFELTVLFAAFTTFFAMLGLNGLPRFSSPVFTNPKFDLVTDDRFFLWIDARDKYFNSDNVRNLLGETDAVEVLEVREDDSPADVPRPLLVGIFTLILLTLIPGAIVLNMRNTKSEKSRWQVFFDMDFQPYRKTQTPTTIFSDRRVQRPPVPGTVARGELELSDPYYLGYDPDQVAMQTDTGTVFVSLTQEEELSEADSQDTSEDAGSEEAAGQSESDTEGASNPGTSEESGSAADQAASESESAEESGDEPTPPAEGEPNYAWLEQFPLELDDSLYKLGKAKFEQNCAVCHGYGGYGNGLVSQRATNLNQGYWLTPTSLHEDRIQKQAVGRIYYTITNGKGKMGGYAASLTPKERWAVVFYVRALQRSQNASEQDIPAGVELAAAESTGDSTEDSSE